MDRTERFYKIVDLLRARKALSFAALLAELEVSRATLKRDLAYLRSRFDAPIQWDQTRGYSLSTDHQLPGLWFSSAEIHALLTMHQLLANLDAGGVLMPHVAPLMARLNTLLGDAADVAADQLRRRVRIIGLAQRAVQPTHFQRVGSALVQRKRLALTYLGRGSNAVTEREVSPLRLVHYRGNWYMDAWCHLRHELRSFALDCIQAAHALDTPAHEVPDAELDAVFAPSYGLFSGSHIQWAHLLFSKERARWVSGEPWHPDQQSQWQPDGQYLLRLPYADHRELIMDILKHGEHCEVLEPANLRDLVAQQVRAMAGKYFLGEAGGGSRGEPAGR